MSLPQHLTRHEDFPQFSLLPKELRLKIWKFTLPSHRIVAIEYPEFESPNLVPSKTKQVFRSKCPAPTTLLVCRESYEAASTIYSRAFSSDDLIPQTWFDFEKDTLFLDQRGIPFEIDQLTEHLPNDTTNVRNLALHWPVGCLDEFLYWARCERPLGRIMGHFPNVQKITWVYRVVHDPLDPVNLVFQRPLRDRVWTHLEICSASMGQDDSWERVCTHLKMCTASMGHEEYRTSLEEILLGDLVWRLFIDYEKYLIQIASTSAVPVEIDLKVMTSPALREVLSMAQADYEACETCAQNAREAEERYLEFQEAERYISD